MNGQLICYRDLIQAVDYIKQIRCYGSAMGTLNLRFVESLPMIGVPRERAQSLAELLERDIDERYSLRTQVLATKRDLADLEIRIMREMAQRNDQTNDRIAESKSEIIKWNLGALIAIAGVFLAFSKLPV
jgi:hypothetical protein